MPDVVVSGPEVDGAEEVLTALALALVADLQRRFGPVRTQLLAARAARREQVRRTGRLGLLAETAHVRDDPTWRVAPAPPDLADRRVEITGPTDPKMAVNALNAGARVWLADLEDANTPHWANVVGGQRTLRAVTRGTLTHDAPDGRHYAVRPASTLPGGGPEGRATVVVVRPRGWHLEERHLLVDGAPVAAALADVGLHAAHNAAQLLARGSGPYYYLPKLESHLEARLWDQVFTHVETALGLAHGSIRATVLIETITAAFEMEEILYELREHASGLNAGRWDYLFSIIKTFRDAGPAFVLPDRAAVTMTAPFMRAYTRRLVDVCHRRGAVAMGGMAALVPQRRDPAATERALATVRADKEREAAEGFDGSWVAHPDLVPVCRQVFDRVLGDRPNQLHRAADGEGEALPGVDALLDLSGLPGAVTLAGVRSNVDVALRYLTAWLGGSGAVAIHGLMEDAATAEIARSQLWQWVRTGTTTAEGAVVTDPLVRDLVAQVLAAVLAEPAAAGSAEVAQRCRTAAALLLEVALGEEFVDFLTVPASAHVD
ncbi:MAG: Malate synthase [uncultured Quadrisphaera sp.]|uniref:Malate synthase n=1 Tax=uncultured Quadrisphaera sp. TaxID=904978 RepID=A0A6J4PWN7_9ACTN|nr:MAG: Malate synthase [uncultured Quadrisphaera sp.]